MSTIASPSTLCPSILHCRLLVTIPHLRLLPSAMSSPLHRYVFVLFVSIYRREIVYAAGVRRTVRAKHKMRKT